MPARIAIPDNLFYIMLIIIVLYGCSTPKVQTYPDAALPDDQIARLSCAPYVSVHSVNSDDSYRLYAGGGLWYTDCEIKLLPGKHNISVCYDESYSTGTLQIIDRCGGSVDVTFEAEAAHAYRIHYEKSSKGWRPYISHNTGQDSKAQGIPVSSTVDDWYPVQWRTQLEPNAYKIQRN